jgi:hypothetical protein
MFSAAFAAICFAAVSSHAAAMKQDADVFSGRDKKIGQLREGATVTVVEESGEWIKLRYETSDATFEGYVKRDLVDATTAAPQTSADPTNQDTVAKTPAAMTATVVTARVGTQRGGPELALNSHWQLQSKSSGLLAADFASMLKRVAKPNVNLAADQNYVLYKELYYLMPLADALKQFGQTSVSPDPVNTPGFPADSFKSYSFDPHLENITRLTLVGDMKNQLVAVQTTETGSKEPWMYSRLRLQEPPAGYSDTLKLYDIIAGKTKGLANWRMAAIAEAANGVVRIDTELVNGNPDLVSTVKSKERVRLYLPQPVADLCAYLLQNRR